MCVVVRGYVCGLMCMCGCRCVCSGVAVCVGVFVCLCTGVCWMVCERMYMYVYEYVCICLFHIGNFFNDDFLFSDNIYLTIFKM